MDKYIGNNFHSLHYGDFKVLGYDTISGKRQRYIVKFSKTGTIKSAARYAIASGNVKDPYYPAILGVGCVGNVVVKGNNYIYQTWQNMLRRCYDPQRHNYSSYGGRGCRVSKRWLCFEYFLEDICTLPGYNLSNILSGKLVLDKDTLKLGNKIYSKETTQWLSVKENTEARNTITYSKKYDIFDAIDECIAHEVTLNQAVIITGYAKATLHAHIYKNKQLGKGYRLLRV